MSIESLGFGCGFGFVVVAALVLATAVPAAADPPDFKTPICPQPAVTGLKVVNDRWPDASSPRQFALDAIRLENAKTDQEKAIAVWLWIRRFTMYTNGTAPAERTARGPRQVLDPMKILNVWGAHWCDGLAKCMEVCWRSLGYPAQKFYKSGHTLCDAAWVDDDGVLRYHLFDVSEGWFAFTRDGKRIAGAEDLARDSSLAYRPAVGPALRTHSLNSIYGWVHCAHQPLDSGHRTELQMRTGENFLGLWSNGGAPFQDNVGKKGDNVPEEHGPFKPNYGSGTFSFIADLSETGLKAQCAIPPGNCRTVHEGSRDLVEQADPAQPAVMVYRVLTPYIISGLTAMPNGRSAKVELSDDGGKNWREFQRDLNISGFALGSPTKDGKEINAFGRYDVLIRITLSAGKMTKLNINWWVQQNLFALPQLLPGDNKITVRGGLAQGTALRVFYFWKDEAGVEQKNETIASELPHTYTIRTAGKKWGDVVSGYFNLCTIPPGGRVTPTVTNAADAPLQKIEPMPSYLVSLGKSEVPALKSLVEYLAVLKSSTDKDSLSDALAAVRVIAFKDAKAAADGKAYAAVREVAMNNLDRPKIEALQVMYWLDRKRATAEFVKIVREEEPAMQYLPEQKVDAKDVNVITDDRDPRSVRRGQFNNVVAVVSRFLADEHAVEVAPVLAKIAAAQEKTRDEPRRALLRSLGELGDKSAGPVLMKYLASDADDAEVAAEALGRVGEREAMPLLRKLAGSADYSPLRRNCIRALGQLNDRDGAEAIRGFLTNADEDARAAAAEALAAIGDTASLDAMRKQLAVEPQAFVRQAIRASIEKLSAAPKAK